MNDNPYAAPEGTPLAEIISPAAAGILAVSRAFRIVGWIGVAGYGPGGLIMTGLLTYAIFIKKTAPPDKVLIEMAWFTLGTAALFSIGWVLIRTGQRLLDRNRNACYAAIFLSCLMVIFFPLAPLGIYCLTKLWKHWRAYCEEHEANTTGSQYAHTS